MKHCPNPECRYRQRHGTDAEYQDSATVCSDCGTALVEGGASRPETQEKPSTPAAPKGAGPWGRLGVSILCSALLGLASFVPLPGSDDLMRNVHQTGLVGLSNLAARLSLMAIGFTPALSAYMIVELALLIVPAWRGLRLGGSESRRAPHRFVIGLSALLAFVQSVGIATWLRDLGGPGTVLMAVRPWVPWVAIVLLPLGTLVFAGLSAAIDRWGLGDGLSTLIVASSLPAIVSAIIETVLVRSSADENAGTGLVLLGVMIVGVVTGTVLALNRQSLFRATADPFTIEIPPSGIGPLVLPSSLLALPASAAAIFGLQGFDLRNLGGFAYNIVVVVLVAALGVVLALLYNQPRRVAAVWFGKGASEAQVGAARKQVAAAALRGTALLLAIAFLQYFVPTFFNVPFAIGFLVFIVATAVVLDLGKEWSFRRSHPGLSRVWPVHRVYAVQPALAALSAAGIPAFPRGLHHRTLLQFFGPYVPITLLVPAEKAEDAERIVRERLVPELKQ